jgi:hypothetical protein
VVGDVVKRLVSDPAGEGGVTGDGDDVFPAARLIAGDGHAESRRERGAGVARAVAIVRAFGTQHEAVEASRRADRVEPILAAGQQLMHIGLVAYIKEETVVRSAKYAVQRDGELHHSEVGAEMPAIAG